MMKRRQAREDWTITIASLEEFCRSKRQNIDANDWMDLLPDAGIGEDEEACSPSSPGEGVCPPSGPSASASSKGAEVPTTFPSEDKGQAESRARQREARVSTGLCDTVEREFSLHRNGTAYGSIGPRLYEDFARTCKDLQGRVSDPNINDIPSVWFGLDDVSKRGLEKWTDLGGIKSHSANYFIVVDADHLLLSREFRDAT